VSGRLHAPAALSLGK